MADAEIASLKKQLEEAKARGQKRWTEVIHSQRRAERAEQHIENLKWDLQDQTVKNENMARALGATKEQLAEETAKADKATKEKEAARTLLSEYIQRADETASHTNTAVLQATAAAKAEAEKNKAEERFREAAWLRQSITKEVKGKFTEEKIAIEQDYQRRLGQADAFIKGLQNDCSAMRADATASKTRIDVLSKDVDTLTKEVDFLKYTLQKRTAEQAARASPQKATGLSNESPRKAFPIGTRPPATPPRPRTSPPASYAEAGRTLAQPQPQPQPTEYMGSGAPSTQLPADVNEELFGFSPSPPPAAQEQLDVRQSRLSPEDQVQINEMGEAARQNLYQKVVDVAPPQQQSRKRPHSEISRSPTRVVPCLHCSLNWWDDSCDSSEPCRNCVVGGRAAGVCQREACADEGEEQCEKGHRCKRVHREDGYQSVVPTATSKTKRAGLKKNRSVAPSLRRG
ncbi:hypothetical protein K504DRAFT_490295 [Pleomassaria siparia CBS 279.74]|uniref:C3H1-type domain-containing protein n=1 Tax=Pleomassaria siparia CBS 279.74 TaxID=1314801 RepID=A0A6G1KBA4_9PLEO|nr:hypothetical protein K504DRAFT_490295 [Pleomassaria siparia CBS 279.74]